MVWASSEAGLRCFGERQGDFLDVLSGGGQQALARDPGQTSETGIAMPVKLLGIGKGAFHRLFSAFVDRLAPRCQPMRISALAGVRPYMAGNGAGCGGV